MDEAIDPSEDETLEQNTHAFFIRLWLEEPSSVRRSAVWRGHISHVITRERRHVQSMQDIVGFIDSYLQRWLEHE
jgi:hypothetical protein